MFKFITGALIGLQLLWSHSQSRLNMKKPMKANPIKLMCIAITFCERFKKR